MHVRHTLDMSLRNTTRLCGRVACVRVCARVCVRVCGCNVGVCVCAFIVCASNACSTMLLVVGASAD